MTAATIEIPATLRGSHPLVAATRMVASGLKARDDARIEVGPREGIAHLIVSRPQLQSALCLLQAVFREAEGRGWEVLSVSKGGYAARAGVAINVRGHAYRIEISELTDRVPVSEDDLKAWRKLEDRRFRFSWEKEREPPTHKSVANGYLRISLPSRYTGARCNWSEGPRGGLEAKLPGFFAELERRADEDDERAREQARTQEARLRREQERMEWGRQARIEHVRETRLREEIDAWRLAHDTREYIAALRLRLDDVEDEERDRIISWCEWAERLSRRTDPTLNLGRIVGLADDEQRSPSAEFAQLLR